MPFTPDNESINVIVGITLFFLLLPFVMLAGNEEGKSKFRIFFIIFMYIAIVGSFFTGFIYTTPAGPWIKDVIKAFMGQ